MWRRSRSNWLRAGVVRPRNSRIHSCIGSKNSELVGYSLPVGKIEETLEEDEIVVPVDPQVFPLARPISKAPNILLLGHSYVRDLQNVFSSLVYVTKFDFLPLLNCHPEFRAYPGSTFLDWHVKGYLHQAVSSLGYYPDIIVLILGGNDIRVDRVDFNEPNPLHHILKSLRLFFTLLNGFFPFAKIIFQEVEPRYYGDSGRHYKSLPLNQYSKLARVLTRYVRRVKIADGIVSVNSKYTGLLDPSLYKKDGVHLKKVGLLKLWDCISFSLKKFL